MLLSSVSVVFVAQSSSEIPEGLMNNPVYYKSCGQHYWKFRYMKNSTTTSITVPHRRHPVPKL